MDRQTILRVENKNHLEKFLEELLSHARYRLDAVLEKIHDTADKSALTAWAKKERAYPLMCGFSQELLCYNLQDNGFSAQPFTSDAIKSSSFSHCAASIPVDLENENKRIHIILDPTYSQFALPAALYPAFGLHEWQARKSPVLFLEKTDVGQALWLTLKDDGYFIVTPECAKLYIESLCPNFTISPKDAMRALSEPSFHSTNLQHGRPRLSTTGCLGLEIRSLLEQTRQNHGVLSSCPQESIFNPTPS